MKNIAIKIFLNSLLGLALIFIWSRFVNLEEVLGALKRADLKVALLFFLLFFTSGVLRGLRFKLLLAKFKIPTKDLVMIYFLSQFLSFMIPIRAGEITKSVYLTSQYQLPLGKTVVWVFMDRFLDFAVVLFLIGTLLLVVPTNLPDQFGKTVFAIFVLLVVFLVLMVKSQSFFKKIVVFLSRFLIISSIKTKFISFSHSVIEGADVLHRPPKVLLGMAFLTFLAIFLDSLIWYSFYLAFGSNIGILKSILANAMTALGYLVPAAPGYVGSTEAGALAVFGGVLGVEANLVSAAAVFFHILTILAVLVFGVSSLYFLKFDLGLVWKKIKRE